MGRLTLLGAGKVAASANTTPFLIAQGVGTNANPSVLSTTAACAAGNRIYVVTTTTPSTLTDNSLADANGNNYAIQSAVAGAGSPTTRVIAHRTFSPDTIGSTLNSGSALSVTLSSAFATPMVAVGIPGTTSYQNLQNDNTGTSTSPAITVAYTFPATVIVSLSFNADPGTITPASGWTLLGTATATVGTTVVYYKTFASGTGETATFTTTNSTNWVSTYGSYGN